MRIVLIPDWYIFARLCLKRICQSRYFAALYQGAWFFIFIRTRLFISVLHYRDKNRDTLLAIFCSCIIKGCVHVSMLLSWFYWKALHQELSLSRRTHPPNLFQEVSTHFFLILCVQLVFWHDMRKSTCANELGRALVQPILYWGYNFFSSQVQNASKAVLPVWQ